MFINIPNNYSSMWGELTYEYNCTDESDLLIQIEESNTGESLGVKKFYSSNSAKLNISHILFETLLPNAQNLSYSDSFITSPNYPSITLRCGEQSCESRTFSYAREPLFESSVITSMPFERILYKGEYDFINTVAPEGSTVSYQLGGVRIDDAQEEIFQVGSTISQGQPLQFAIYADAYSEEYYTAFCEISIDGKCIGRYHYALLGEPSNGYRVAWVSSAGSIEHYTFPIVVKDSYNSLAQRTTQLRSAYGTAAEVEALAEIISSPVVWRVEGMDYSPLEMLTTEQTLRSEGSLMVTNIEVRENG